MSDKPEDEFVDCESRIASFIASLSIKKAHPLLQVEDERKTRGTTSIQYAKRIPSFGYGKYTLSR